ncbi:HAMP domain-containing protein [Oceanospirillum multiglobuliferum]|uniref:histidine kinase n=1 Tax=Oceanospirillum multiglobuliferum TaxID=64969 RepID=A0A1T4PYC6_9GAMM|nr:sensor histidine kinase [Oceanospirillum multiglobuliferum]OPX55433.1 hypothetical protein BTE48_08560 [Oceanospirillum multiglobuliferum]SJZ96560.1 HAMP domain-containing protein [Oceanospirillum multiglobuliferum]
MSSIRKQLLAGSVLLTLVSVLMTFTLTMPVSFSALDTQARAQVHQSSQLAGETVKIFWDEVVRSMNLLARIRGFAELEPEQAFPLIEALSRQNSAFELVALYDKEGNVIAQTSLYGKKSAPNVSSENFFRRSLNRHEEFVSAPTYLPDLDAHFVQLSVPVRDQQDKVNGVLVASINLQPLRYRLAQVSNTIGGTTYLVDGQYQLIASGSKIDSAMLASVRKVLTQPALQKQLQISGHAALDLYSGIEGDKVLGNLYRVFGTPWTVVAEVSYDKVLAPIHKIIYLSLGGALVAMLIVFWVSRVLTRRITEPLQMLTHAAKQVSQGEYQPKLEIHSPVEFVLLSEAFNDMAMQVKEAIESLQKLNDELEHRVSERTKTLSETLSYLQRTQSELIQREKMAALGELVAGVAHEINTPIGICVTASSHIAHDLKQLKNALETQNLTASMLQEFIEDTDNALALMSSNLHRGSQLINDFKKVAVDQSHDDVRAFLLVEYVRAVANSLTPSLKMKKHKVLVEGIEELEVVHNPGAFSQIITNLIMNSVIHGFGERAEGLIHIQVQDSERADEVVVEYSDNGAGMDQEQCEKVFNPFYTTRRGAGGSGLGGNIIFNLVTQVLKGTIEVHSEIGQGVHFTIRFPRSLVS